MIQVATLLSEIEFLSQVGRSYSSVATLLYIVFTTCSVNFMMSHEFCNKKILINTASPVNGHVQR